MTIMILFLVLITTTTTTTTSAKKNCFHLVRDDDVIIRDTNSVSIRIDNEDLKRCLKTKPSHYYRTELSDTSKNQTRVKILSSNHFETKEGVVVPLFRDVSSLSTEFRVRFASCESRIECSNNYEDEDENENDDDDDVIVVFQVSNDGRQRRRCKGGLLFFDQNETSSDERKSFTFTYSPSRLRCQRNDSDSEISVYGSNSSDCKNRELVEKRTFLRTRLIGDSAVLDYSDLRIYRYYAFYCVVVESRVCQRVCLWNSSIPISSSSSTDVPPLIGHIIPYCSSHFRCLWIYILCVGIAVFVLSFVLAVCCLWCCDCCHRKRRKRSQSRQRRRRRRQRRSSFQQQQQQQLPQSIMTHVLGSLTPSEEEEERRISGIRIDSFPRKTWTSLHAEWDEEDPPKNPGKILLLYSRDSSLFIDLQTAFKSFLESACHCVVWDLFDDALFRRIAYDPELWLTEHLRHDPDFKVLVVVSQGAAKRCSALRSKEVLNIPDNSSMDGLFSAGLKFVIQDPRRSAACLATIKYETLQDFTLDGLVERKQFLVPKRLDELFCWIHGYDDSPIGGNPWVGRYQLELQLLQEALKRVKANQRNSLL